MTTLSGVPLPGMVGRHGSQPCHQDLKMWERWTKGGQDTADAQKRRIDHTIDTSSKIF